MGRSRNSDSCSDLCRRKISVCLCQLLLAPLQSEVHPAVDPPHGLHHPGFVSHPEPLAFPGPPHCACWHNHHANTCFSGPKGRQSPAQGGGRQADALGEMPRRIRRALKEFPKQFSRMEPPNLDRASPSREASWSAVPMDRDRFCVPSLATRKRQRTAAVQNLRNRCVGSWRASFRFCACIGTMNPKRVSRCKSTGVFSGSWRGR